MLPFQTSDEVDPLLMIIWTTLLIDLYLQKYNGVWLFGLCRNS